MTIGTYSAGDVLSADSLNSFGNVTIVRQTRNIPNNSNTTIDFTGGELVDVGGWYSNSSAIQPNVTGVYLLTANSLNLNSSSGRGLINLFVDSTIVASSDDNDLSRGLVCRLQVQPFWHVSALLLASLSYIVSMYPP